MSEPTWKQREEELKGWMDWARTKVDPETSIGRFGFSSRPGFSPNKATRAIDELRQRGWIRNLLLNPTRPIWWVQPPMNRRRDLLKPPDIMDLLAERTRLEVEHVQLSLTINRILIELRESTA